MRAELYHYRTCQHIPQDTLAIHFLTFCAIKVVARWYTRIGNSCKISMLNGGLRKQTYSRARVHRMFGVLLVYASCNSSIDRTPPSTESDYSNIYHIAAHFD